MTYEIVIGPAGEGYQAICPRLPGIAATGATPGAALDAAVQQLRERLGRTDLPVTQVRATLEDQRRSA